MDTPDLRTGRLVRWKFTLQFEDEDGHVARVQVRDSVPRTDALSEWPLMAGQLARLMAALDSAANVNPCIGEDVRGMFCDVFEQEWATWALEDEDDQDEDDDPRFSVGNN